MIWTPEKKQRFRDLWAEGHSTAEIGRRLGCGKNAVCGMRRRIDLTPRRSACKPSGVTDDQILDQLVLGRGAQEVANLLHVGCQRTINIRNSAGIEVRRRLKTRRRITRTMQDQAFAMFRDGRTIHEVRAVLKVAMKRVCELKQYFLTTEAEMVIRSDAQLEWTVVEGPPVRKTAEIIEFPRGFHQCSHVTEGPRRTWLHCSEPAVKGKSYCAEHQALYYVPVRRAESVA